MAISGGMIANPVKKFTVEKSLDFVKLRVKNLYKLYGSIDIESSITEENDFANTFIYKVKDGGLSYGTKAVISLHTIAENRTEVEIEMQRVVGSYDTDYEVSQSNDQIKAIISCLGKLAEKSDEEVVTFTPTEDEIETTNMGVGATIVMVLAVIIIVLLTF